MYASVDPRVEEFTNLFCIEAEILWQTERETDSILNMVACQFLSLGYIGQAKNHAVLTYLQESCDMGVRMGLFGVDESLSFDELSAKDRKACAYTAWGVFNWIMQVHFKAVKYMC